MRRLALVSLALVAALAPAAPVGAKNSPARPPFRVLVLDEIPSGMFARFARLGAVGLMRAEIGPTTNRRQSLAALERGTEVNARLGGVPSGPRRIAVSGVTGSPTAENVVVVELPPRGRPVANDRLYRIAVIGRGFHGLLGSPTTRIPGLVSVVDVAPTVLGRPSAGLSSLSDRRPLADLSRLAAQVHGEDRLKYASLLILAGALLLCTFLRRPEAATAIPAALLVNIGIGAAQVANEVAIVALFTAGTVLGAFLLARVCRRDLALLALVGGVLLLSALALARQPGWAALTPLGPDQNQRFWGIGDQIATLLLAPLLTAGLIARQRLGPTAFAAVALLGLLVMADNRLGANGGGAIGLGTALAVLGARLIRRGLVGLVALLGASAASVFAVVLDGLAGPGPNHLRSAFSGGWRGLLDVGANRVPLVYLPALRDWPLTAPLGLCLVLTLVYAFRAAGSREGRSLVLATAAGVAASLLVNDATGFMLAGGIACLAAVARLAPEPAPARAPLPGWSPLRAGWAPGLRRSRQR